MKKHYDGLPIIILVAIVAVLIPVIIVSFTLIWNATIPAITGWTEISYTQTVGIFVLASYLSLSN